MCASARWKYCWAMILLLLLPLRPIGFVCAKACIMLANNHIIFGWCLSPQSGVFLMIGWTLLLPLIWCVSMINVEWIHVLPNFRSLVCEKFSKFSVWWKHSLRSILIVILLHVYLSILQFLHTIHLASLLFILIRSRIFPLFILLISILSLGLYHAIISIYFIFNYYWYIYQYISFFIYLYTHYTTYFSCKFFCNTGSYCKTTKQIDQHDDSMVLINSFQYSIFDPM